MSYSDFDLSYETFGGLDILDQPSGSAITNASLSSPLTTTGAYCRRFSINDSVASGLAGIKALCKSTVLSGTVYNPAEDTALSLRTWVRLSTPQFPTDTNSKRRVWAGVTAFTTNPSGTYLFGGWELNLEKQFVTSGSASVALKLLGGPATSSTTDIFDPAYNLISTVESGLATDTWYLIRLDIVPNSASQKTITAYRSTDGGTSWNTLATHVSTLGDPDWPPTPTVSVPTRCGFSFGSAHSYSFARTVEVYGYFDRFQISSETVP